MTISVAASLAAAAIHFALGPHHVEELGALGLGFYLAGILQAGFAVALVVGRNTVRAPRAFVVAGTGVNATILAAWVVSRLVGLPAGPQPWTPEAIGVADSVSAALEVLIVAMGVVLLRRAPASAERPRESVRVQSFVLGPAIALIAVATSFALLSPDGVAGHGADGHGQGLADARWTTPDVDPSAEIEPFAPAAPDVDSDPTGGHDHAEGDETESHAH